MSGTHETGPATWQPMHDGVNDGTEGVAHDVHVLTRAYMGTVVSLQVVGHGTSARARRERAQGMERAFAWFARVESVCSRFDANSELRRLCEQIGTSVPVSDMLFETVQFALAVADATDGAFDPTVGQRMESRGFNRDYRTGLPVHSGTAAHNSAACESAEPDSATHKTASYRDVHLDAGEQAITLARPLLLDLGAVAKGLAVDMAARELAPFANFAVDAGGDLYLGGHSANGNPWSVGIRHPRQANQLFETLALSDCAVCTSGDYERRVSRAPQAVVTDVADVHHIMNPHTGNAVAHTASVTVVAPSAMVADALATAAFVLGPDAGMTLLQQHGVRGILITPSLERFATS